MQTTFTSMPKKQGYLQKELLRILLIPFLFRVPPLFRLIAALLVLPFLAYGQGYIEHSSYFGTLDENTYPISIKVVNGETYFLGYTEGADYPVTMGVPTPGW